MRVRKARIMVCAVIGLLTVSIAGCTQKSEPLVVYAGKGLKNAVEEIKDAYQQQTGDSVTVIYAGSDTLLGAIKKSHKGDVYIPGSAIYIKLAGELVATQELVVGHTPVFAVRKDNAKKLLTYADLLRPGVRIAIGNKGMCAIGSISESILSEASPQESFRSNVVITGSTVNELLQLVVDGEVDASLIWTDMLQWHEAKDLISVVIPENINKPNEVRVALLSTSNDPERARRFVTYVATEGRVIFVNHGYGE